MNSFSILLTLLFVLLGAAEPTPTTIFITDVADYFDIRQATLLLSYDQVDQIDTRHFRLFKDLVQVRLSNSKSVKKWEAEQKATYRSLSVIDLRNGNAVDAVKDFIQMSHTQRIGLSIWLFICNSTISLTPLEAADIPFNAEVLLATLVSEDLAYIDAVYKVQRSFPLRVNIFGNWSRDAGLYGPAESLYLRRWNLEGINLRTGSVENSPVTTFNPKWDGYYPKIWRVLEQRLNFTSTNIRSEDESTGDVVENGRQAVGLVGMLLRNKIDVIVSEMKMTEPRSKYLDFTNPLLSSKYQVYFRQGGFNLDWSSVLKPFGKNTWIAICCWILAGALALSLCHYFSTIMGRHDGSSGLGPTEALYFMLQSLCQQGYPDAPKTDSGRILFLMSYVVSGVLVPSYSASLISYLTFHVPSRPFDSLEEMLQDGRYHLIIEKNTAEYSLFSQATDQTYSKVYDKLVRTIPDDKYPRNLTMAINQICVDRRYGLFGVEATISYLVTNRPWDDCTIMWFSKPLSVLHEAIALRKGDPLTGVFNYQILRLSETGVIRQMRDSVWQDKVDSPGSSWSSVDTSEVFFIFSLLLFGLIVSLLLLCVERLRSTKLITQHNQDHSS